MYITATSQANIALEVGRIINDSALIKGIIDTDRTSTKKRDMIKGVNYYLGKHDILTKKFNTYMVNGIEYVDENAANNRVPNPFHSLFVKQKISYLLSVDPSVKGLTDESLLTKNFYKLLRSLATNASNKAEEWLHVYINENGEFDSTIAEAENIIADYDSRDKNKLLSIMRYYYVDYVTEKGELKQKTKVEIWTDQEVYFYIEDSNGNYVLDLDEQPNPRPHWVLKQQINQEITDLAKKSFGEVPFIHVKNNEEILSDLSRIKGLIDLYDLILSGFANNIEDIQDAIWNLKGYEGTELKEFMINLRKYKAVKTSEGGGIEPHTLEIPVDAKNKLLEILEDKIYAFGRAFNTNDKNFAGQITGVALKYKYTDLDLKANELGVELEQAILKYIEFYNKFKNTNTNLDNVTIVYNKKSIVNESDVIDNINKSKDDLSLRTRLELNPLVTDVDKEINRKSLEDEGFTDFGNDPTLNQNQ